MEDLFDSDYLEERFKPIMQWVKSNERGFQKTLIEDVDDVKSLIRVLDTQKKFFDNNGQPRNDGFIDGLIRTRGAKRLVGRSFGVFGTGRRFVRTKQRVDVEKPVSARPPTRLDSRVESLLKKRNEIFRAKVDGGFVVKQTIKPLSGKPGRLAFRNVKTGKFVSNKLDLQEYES